MNACGSNGANLSIKTISMDLDVTSPHLVARLRLPDRQDLSFLDICLSEKLEDLNLKSNKQTFPGIRN